MGKDGRITEYDSEIAEQICELLESGVNLTRICRENENFPKDTTVRRWARLDIDGFYQRYTRAREMGIDAIVDEIFEISDDMTGDKITKVGKDGREYEAVDYENINRARLKVDSRKWYLAKLAPRRFGEKIDLGGQLDNPIITEHKHSLDPKDLTEDALRKLLEVKLEMEKKAP